MERNERVEKPLIVAVLMLLAFLTGCAASQPLSDVPNEQGPRVSMLCEAGDYHGAMRELPNAMSQWAEYTKRTGSTAEGAAGHLYATTMFTIAEKGDAHWGRILDDPDIPYEYKTEMVFEILEARLGKGAVYVGNESNLIVPRSGRIDLTEEMIKLPEQDGSQQTAPAGGRAALRWVDDVLE